MTESERLRIQCAWCGREMAPGANPTTHGICDACLARVSGQRALRRSHESAGVAARAAHP
ncbi:MAG: hypothetical protein U0547_01800 [Dehalococcoidia bacterium]